MDLTVIVIASLITTLTIQTMVLMAYLIIVMLKLIVLIMAAN